ncbi:MAG: ABC transporter ATP-binding protein [Cyanobacteria bacterium J06649_11]
MSEHFSKRKNELINLISSNSINQATKRLIDFTNDFSKNKDLINNVILIRSHYSKIRNEEVRIGQSSNLDYNENKLLIKLLDVINLIEEEYTNSILTQDISIQDSSVNSEPITPFQSEVVPASDVVKIAEVHEVEKSYKGFHLKPISFNLQTNEIIGLVGKNGSGKSTLLKILANKIRVDSGEVRYIFSKDSDLVEVMSMIKYIPQEGLITSKNTTVENELKYYLAAYGVRGKQNSERAREVLLRLELEQFGEKDPNKLSGGYKLRFELAKIFGIRPKVVILDEPLANLDINAQQLFLQDIYALSRARKYKSTIIISSQHIEEIESIADKIIFLNDGECLFNDRIEFLGKTRKSNTIELQSNNSYEEVYEVLLSFDKDSKLKKSGNKYVIDISKDLKVQQLLVHLIHAKIDFKYFQDISLSTKKIFQDLQN